MDLFRYSNIIDFSIHIYIYIFPNFNLIRFLFFSGFIWGGIMLANLYIMVRDMIVRVLSDIISLVETWFVAFEMP